MPADFDQYSTAKPLLAGLPAWINDEQEQKRIASYQLYEEIYWTAPQTFKLMARGQDAEPIYIPSGRVIVETMHRYLANKMKVIVDPAFGSDTEKALAEQVMTDFVRRERFYSRFNSNKRYGLIRGDWCWHLYADPTKAAGSRISLFPLDPGGLFPIYNEENLDEVVGYHIVEQFISDGQVGERGKVYMRRLTYRKTTGVGGPSPITVEDTVFEVDAWGGPNMEEKAIKVMRPATVLPSPIDSLPIYTVPNFDEPGAMWGSSEMRGLERLMAAVNQGISDEELTLAMDGLGLYATNAGAPLDPDSGEELPWDLGPAKVVEVPADAFFNRVSGVSTVTPMQDHLRYLHEQLDLSAGTPAVAKGKVDVQVAESGVALLLDLAPILSKGEEKEQIVTDITTNMLFDLAKWFVAYEGTIFNSLMEITRWVPVYGAKVPPNETKLVEQLIAMATATPPILPLNVVWDKLRKLGYEDLPTNEDLLAATLEQQTATAQATVDAMAGQIGAELNNPGLDPNNPENQ
jgi:hypothetical protein